MKIWKALAAFVLTLTISGLSHATVDTVITPSGIAVKRTVLTKAATATISTNRSPVKTNGWGGCGLVPDAWECASDIYYEWSFEFSYGGFDANVTLVKQVIDGQRSCSMMIDALIILPGCNAGDIQNGEIPFYDYLPPQGQEEFLTAVDEVLAEELPLPKCVIATAQSTYSDTDHANALASFKSQYASSLSTINSGQIFDAVYGNGMVIRFTLVKTSGLGGVDWRVRLPRVVGPQSPSPCYPKT